MGTKTGLLIGFAVGFVLGARAGEERYEQIKAFAGRVRGVPIVAKPLDAAGEKVADSVRSKGEEISDAIAEVVKEKLFGVHDEPREDSAEPDMIRP